MDQVMHTAGAQQADVQVDALTVARGRDRLASLRPTMLQAALLLVVLVGHLAFMALPLHGLMLDRGADTGSMSTADRTVNVHASNVGVGV